MQPPNDGAQVDGSPVGLGQTISEQHREIVVATDIKSVWNGGSELGGCTTVPTTAITFKRIVRSNPRSPTAPTGDAPITQLPPGDPSRNLPSGSTLISGIDHADRHSSPLAGRQYHNSPETVGDQIPAVRGTTAVTGINAIMDGQTCTGWGYKGGDGHNYYQRRTDTTPQPEAQGSIAVFSGSVSPAQVGAITPYAQGVLRVGEHLQPMDAQSRIFDDHLDGSSKGNAPAPVIHAAAETKADNPTLAALGVSVGDYATIQSRGPAVVATIEMPGQQHDLGLGRQA